MSSRWYRVLELMLILIVLVILGGAYFSRITPEQRRQIELEAGLEQIYQFERGCFYYYGQYLDPTDELMGLNWPWMKNYSWDVRMQGDRFWIAASADLDGDGEKGIWVIDEKSPVVHQLVED